MAHDKVQLRFELLKLTSTKHVNFQNWLEEVRQLEKFLTEAAQGPSELPKGMSDKRPIGPDTKKS